ncbi:sorting nexin-16-like [Scleropages formosus]|uniref:Sorting nexin-16 n=1 Tax=Scleropages formosus TaxID=113540 RepID=A0A8C9RDK5_SCLFO|nr:sorting nexin-16-like [Scleropages formosus]
MAAPFAPVPTPMRRASQTTGSFRNWRTASLDSVSSSSSSSTWVSVLPGTPSRGHPCLRPSASLPGRAPALHPHSSIHVSGTLTEYSSSSRLSWEDGPITPTVLGYEVMEERAKFTVYKILVRKTPQESWVVFRRYTDFSRLNDKLREMFPGFRLSLPPKRWFKNNYNLGFLEDRQLGLQTFLRNLVAHKDVANCLPVRDFLCLDDPPGPFDSLEESRAFCETLEESNYRLQKELQEKQREINTLRKMLEEQQQHIDVLERRIHVESLTPESPCQLSAQGSESSVDVDVDVDVDAECSAAEADREITEDKSRSVKSSRRSSCWCGPDIANSPPVIPLSLVRQEQ